ncbi:MAG: type II secretion system protein [Candidatus Riflebacteria bacterium]|nr:type II secretion system protein [Candidatus Riflebacteria bacterium]
MNKSEKRRGFSMTEIIVIIFIVSLIATSAYKIMSTVFSHFTKSQTKLTNLRMANVVIEWMKSDVRACVIPSRDEEKPKIEETKCSFCITDNKGENSREMVEYVFKDHSVTRTYKGQTRILTGKVQITDMKFAEVLDEKTKSRALLITIKVDRDKDLEVRTESQKMNVVQLETILYPKFYEECLSVEEKYWNSARRNATGGV